ncbi:MAG: thioredoxin [Calditrichaeota bacterium]|nr:thioredoxin [Calditrichota bacterium]
MFARFPDSPGGFRVRRISAGSFLDLLLALNQIGPSRARNPYRSAKPKICRVRSAAWREPAVPERLPMPFHTPARRPLMSLKSLDRNNFDQEVSQGLVLVDFWATWCAPCNALTPVLEKIADDSSLNVRVAKVDVDANRELMMRFNVRSIPTMIYFKDGRPVDQTMGLVSREQIVNRIQKHNQL